MVSQFEQECVVKLDIPATLKYLHIVSTSLDGLLTEEMGLAQRDIVSHNIQLAVQEVCTNIVQHAYREPRGNERIRITSTLQSKNMTIELFDTGSGFDPSEVQEPDLENGQVHGYGLFIARNLMNEVTYRRHADGNHWYLLKEL